MNIKPHGSDGEDFTLSGKHAWITVGNLSVRINNSIDTMSIGVWELGDEFNDPVDEMTVYQPVKMKIVGKKIVKTAWATKTNRTKE